MKTILVVDDEPAIVETLEEVLSWEGYRVLSAANGALGLAILGRERPDLLLVDFMMPVMDGVRMLRQVRGELAQGGLPAILMTAAPLAVGDGRCWDLLLEKPFDVHRLMRAVRKLLP
jgi:CheY-like chemotaxis protein